MRNDIETRKEEILLWITENRSKAEIAKLLSCRLGTLENALTRMGIEYSGNKGSKGRKIDAKYLTADEYIKSNYVSSHKLRVKLLRDGIKKHECELCGQNEWMNKPIPLELDHIDGNRYNNDLTNLRVICPNCHAQTDTYSGKNVGNYMRM
jgi:5-methylcytosine-specific restriction endonuclease McrA